MGERISILLNPRDRTILDDCATIHSLVIPGGFLPTFGRYFLRHLYDFFASSEKSFLIVARENDETLGFICGSYGVGSLYKSFVIRKAVFIGVPVCWKLLSRGTMRKVLEVVSYPVGEERDDLPGSEILNFCVSSECQGKGVGAQLFQESTKQFAKHGIGSIRIVTGSDQVSAQRFYEKMGATLVTTVQVHDGDDSLMYTYQIET